MTDTPSTTIDGIESWLNRLMGNQHSNSAALEAASTVTPDQQSHGAGNYNSASATNEVASSITPNHQLQREVDQALIDLRGTTALILNERDAAARRIRDEQASGSKVSRLLGRFVWPFEGDKETTIERQRTEAEIRQELINTESQLGGWRLFGANTQTRQQDNWFGIDAFGNAVWVRLEPGQNGGPQQARVTTIYFGLEPGDEIYKVQSLQEVNSTEPPKEVMRTMISVRELQNLTATVRLLHETVARPLYCPGAKATSRPAPAREPDIHSRSAPIDAQNFTVAA
jgi:hypothetical protein